MKTRFHRQSIRLKTSPAEVFSLLITPSAIREWWNARSAIVQPERGGIWIAAWGEDEDRPEYITSAVMSVFDPPKRILLLDYTYTILYGRHLFDADFSVEFLIIPSAAQCLLQVTQKGFPIDPVADPFFAACETGWKSTLKNIAVFVGRHHG